MSQIATLPNLLDNLPAYNGPGVYAIINKISGKMYIGCSVAIKTRFYQHLKMLDNSKHYAKELQQDYINGALFELKILKKVENQLDEKDLKANLLFEEKQLILLHQSYIPEQGYNEKIGMAPSAVTLERWHKHMADRRVRIIKEHKRNCDRWLRDYPKMQKGTISTFRRIIDKYGIEAICAALDCQPGDLFQYIPSSADGENK